ncbi:hexokinase [Desulfosporosinus orientis DSM 765]|uniref:Hexokinase n=1 Tax=Desulfosporosinus orientis (strain ATCC 19365 / DSM 765 / NCIMB 8382 / VKM B-1628 / Singapore I) TaxID=768706 RepID=G7W9L9_DESOD|nr:hexokinase [Desulfosporosinus orientis]AET69936.1 hexokinase [Desulfosporosinus orientis DSM 765]
MLEQLLAFVEQEMLISTTQILTISLSFQEHMTKGLSGLASSLKMFPSYLGAPSGGETGTFLAFDFGGSNVRAALVDLKGEGNYLEFYRQSRPLANPETGYDYRDEAVTAAELFDFLAGIIQEVLNKAPVRPTHCSLLTGPLPLGFAFSFPYRQQRIGEGVLLHWDKEVKTSGVAGKDVGCLLNDALSRCGLDQDVKPTAIINDTVATYLTAAYGDPGIEIASIIGTGHNSCYLEPRVPNFESPILINTESGNFSAAPTTFYDLILDQQSENPGEQLFEKKLSGKYLGELLRIIVLDFSQRGVLKLMLPPRWHTPYDVNGKDLALILTEKADLDLNSSIRSGSEGLILQRIAHLLTKRSARLAAASFIGIVQHLDPYFENPHTIAVDGSLYEKMPGYAQEIRAALNDGLGTKSDLIKVRLSSGSSLTGAAIAAALVSLNANNSTRVPQR